MLLQSWPSRAKILAGNISGHDFAGDRQRGTSLTWPRTAWIAFQSMDSPAGYSILTDCDVEWEFPKDELCRRVRPFRTPV